MPCGKGGAVPCEKGGALPEMTGIEELGSIITELEDGVSGLAGELSDAEAEDEVLGAGVELPVLPRQNDWTHPKYA